MFRAADGSPITAQRMIELLQSDADEAVSFLKDVHAAAVRMVKVKRSPSKAS